MRFPSRQAYVTQALVNLSEANNQEQIRTTYATLLKWCGKEQALPEGRIVHEHFLRNGHHDNVFLGNCAIQMYKNCGHLQEARRAFDNMQNKDTVSWNAIIAAYAKDGHCTEALRIFMSMSLEGFRPNNVTFVSALGACATLKALEMGKRIHEIACFYDDDIVLGTAIVNMYGKCGSLQDARRTFDALPEHKSVVSWTSIITSYAQLGQQREALILYKRMPVEPNRVTYLVVLGACANLGDLEAGKEIHDRIKHNNMLNEPSIGAVLVNMYAKCGKVQLARELFESLQKRDVVAWTSMITAYTENMQGIKALELYKDRDFQNLEPNSVTFISLLAACTLLGNLEEGKAIHERIVGMKLEPYLPLETSLISMYGNCGNLQAAREVFYNMKVQNLVAWNAIINVHAQREEKEALYLFKRMEQAGVLPEKVTFVCLLTACASLEALDYGRSIHERVKCMGFLPYVILETALLNMYAKCNECHKAYEVFEAMRDPDVVAWTAVINSYAQGGHHKKAMEMFKKMKFAGVIANSTTFLSVISSCSTAQNLEDGLAVHDEITSRGINTELVENALLNMYCKCGSLQLATKFFHEMEHRNVVSYNTIISTYVYLGHGKEAVELYNGMDVQPDHNTLVLALCACSTMGALNDGNLIYASNQLPFNLLVQNTLISMYGKCGALKEARDVFEAIKEANLISWTAIIVGYAQHGHSKEAEELYKRMHLDGAQPDAVMFMSILIACIHSGLVVEGRHCFLSMRSDWNIKPLVEHYIYMIDLLGKGGRLDEAEELVKNMPFEPGIIAWNTLLGACDIHNDLRRGKRVADHVFKFYAQDGGSHVLISNLCRRQNQSRLEAF